MSRNGVANPAGGLEAFVRDALLLLVFSRVPALLGHRRMERATCSMCASPAAALHSAKAKRTTTVGIGGLEAVPLKRSSSSPPATSPSTGTWNKLHARLWIR